MYHKQMKDDESINEKDHSEGQVSDEGSLESSEEGFMEGYANDEEVEECTECGLAIDGEKKVVREIEGEQLVFCSKACADEYEEGL